MPASGLASGTVQFHFTVIWERETHKERERMNDDVLIRLENISKRFNGIYALNNVSLEIKKGEVHALCGENGAGKSTLMKILTGIYTADTGKVYMDGEDVTLLSIREKQEKGISIVHQEIIDFPNLSVAKNIYAGIEPMTRYGTVDEKKMSADAAALIQTLGAELDPDAIVGDLDAARRQLTMITKALAYHAKVIIMDEPNSALTDEESEKLFRIINDLKAEGISIIYISHRLEEVMRVSDRISILRDGCYEGTMETRETDIPQLIRMMVGRELKDVYPKRDKSHCAFKEETILEVRNISIPGLLDHISFSLKKGEILGIAGLEGSGRTEMAEVIIGMRKGEADIVLEGENYVPSSPKNAFKKGISYVPPERKVDSVLPQLSIKKNLVISALPDLQIGGVVVSEKKVNAITNRYVQDLRIKLASQDQLLTELSGGNQQKVIIARCLATNPKVIIFNEPTRGIDVGAKYEIYELLYKLADQGIGIILIASEMGEIMGLSERIIAFREGRLTHEFMRAEATEEKVLHAMMNE